MPKSNEELLARYFEVTQQMRDLRKAISDLSVTRGNLLAGLRIFGGMTYPDIAKAVGLSVPHTYQLIQRQYKRLAELEDSDDEGSA